MRGSGSLIVIKRLIEETPKGVWRFPTPSIIIIRENEIRILRDS